MTARSLLGTVLNLNALVNDGELDLKKWMLMSQSVSGCVCHPLYEGSGVAGDHEMGQKESSTLGGCWAQLALGQGAPWPP